MPKKKHHSSHKKHHTSHDGYSRADSMRHPHVDEMEKPHNMMGDRHSKGQSWLMHEDPSKQSHLPTEVMMKVLPKEGEYLSGEPRLPHAYEGVESQMKETMRDFKRTYKPYK
jgi:hypothetical protein